MEQEQKQILLADLCARLPYGVKVERLSKILKLISVRPSYRYCVECELEGGVNMSYEIDDIKPYLRPLSSMTEEEEIEYSYLVSALGDFLYEQESEMKPIQLYKQVPFGLYLFFLSHNFDFIGLIPMGLALEAKEGMYIIKK